MANVINWSDIVGDINSNPIVPGYAGDLLDLSMHHLSKVRDDHQLTDDQVGEIYASTINNALQLAIQFAMTKKENELKTDGVEKDNILKDSKQALADRQIVEIENNIKLSDDEFKLKEEASKASIALNDRQIVEIENNISLATSASKREDNKFNSAIIGNIK